MIKGKYGKNGTTGKTMVKLSFLNIIDDGKDDEKTLKPIVLPLGHLRRHRPNHPAFHVQTTKTPHSPTPDTNSQSHLEF